MIDRKNIYITNKHLVLLTLPIVVIFLPYLLKENLKEFSLNMLNNYYNEKYNINLAFPPINIKNHSDLSRDINSSYIANVIEIKPYKETITTENNNIGEPPEYNISLIYIGVNKRFAIINGQIYKEKDRISSDEVVKKIFKDGVLLDGKWGERWIKFLKY
ncbi:hypothetical protein [Persephonella sp.]